jgi:hypothetical protein
VTSKSPAYCRVFCFWIGGLTYFSIFGCKSYSIIKHSRCRSIRCTSWFSSL